MISLPIGVILTFLVFLFSMGLGNLTIYFNFHSLLIVGGGTVAILFFSSPVSVLRHLIREVVALFKTPYHLNQIKDDLAKLSSDRNAATSSNDDLVKYAQNLWSQGTSQELFVVLISQKKKEIEQRSVDAIQCLKNLAKYPPALGMAGTVMGIVSLFQTLSSNKDAIGPGLAMAMTATFFGLIIANGVVMPLADRLQVKQMSETRYLQNIYQILLLINQDEAADLISDEVNLRAS